MQTFLKNFAVITGLIFTAFASSARANDDIFPPAPAAASAISFDGKGFLVHGKREFIASGSIHFPRVPRELWRERLLQLKRAGFNTVQTYVFWNYQETMPGQMDFSTDAHDLGAFLKTAQEVGLYATVRIGVYACAEWDSGGYPVWLRNIPDLKVRTNNPAFLDAMDKYWDKLIPIVAAQQINRGGNVILVQLENEDPQGWGTEMPNDYFKHMQKKALDLGIEVPYFFSGLHHGTDTGGGSAWDSANRKIPWYSTETWVRWYDAYGNSPPDQLISYTRNVWNILANGGNGFNLYMFHGGTNFDYFNDNSSGASYDYGTLVGQGGDLRNLYYSVRRATTLATSFPDILDDSTNSSEANAKFATAPDVTDAKGKTVPGVRPYARTSPAGTLVFVRNTQNSPQVAALEAGGTLTLDPREVAPMLVDTTLAPGIRVKLATARTLGLATQGKTATWIVYGKSEEKGHIDLDLDQDGAIASGASALFHSTGADAKHPSFDVSFSEDGPGELLLTSGGQTLRILTETVAWTDRTWLVGERGAQSVITGPNYVGDFSEKDGKVTMTVARPFGSPALKDATVYDEDATAKHIAVTDPAPADNDTAPTLSDWEAAKDAAPIAADFVDSSWLSGNPAPQLGADNDPTAYGWYRTGFDAPSAGEASFTAKIYDHANVYVNGQPATVKGHDVYTFNVNAGHNTLAIFVSHGGREKAFGYVDKPIDTYGRKGIIGAASLSLNGQAIAMSDWKLHGGISAPDAATLSWAKAGAQNLGVPAFFRAQFTAKPPGANDPRAIYRLSTKGLSRGSVFLNGHNLGRYPEHLKIDGVYLPECWLKDGANSLVVFDEDGRVPADTVKIWCEKVASREVFQVQQ
jgi:beta-galactosidase